VEQRIQDAMANGLFDNLPGRGKPLPLLTNPYLDSGQELAFGLLKNNGLAPEWIERDKEIRQALAAFRTDMAAAWQQNEAHLAAQFETRLKSLNRRIDDFNLIVPISGKQRPRLNMAAEIRRARTNPPATPPLLG
jgi:DnaJ family protein C protein 28